MGPPIHVIRDFLLNPAGQLPSFHLGFSRPACTIPDDIMSLYCVSHDREIQDEIENRRVEQDYRGLKERVEGPHEGEGPREEVVQDEH